MSLTVAHRPVLPARINRFLNSLTVNPGRGTIDFTPLEKADSVEAGELDVCSVTTETYPLFREALPTLFKVAEDYRQGAVAIAPLSDAPDLLVDQVADGFRGKDRWYAEPAARPHIALFKNEQLRRHIEVYWQSDVRVDVILAPPSLTYGFSVAFDEGGVKETVYYMNLTREYVSELRRMLDRTTDDPLDIVGMNLLGRMIQEGQLSHADLGGGARLQCENNEVAIRAMTDGMTIFANVDTPVERFGFYMKTPEHRRGALPLTGIANDISQMILRQAANTLA